MVLSHLHEVQRLPAAVQADIATRVSSFIQIAMTAKDDGLFATCASAALEEQAKAIGQGATTMDPQWAAPALAEAWCYARFSLSKGYLDRAEAVEIIEAVETFASTAKR
jgi:hypothetical protein